MMWLCPSICCCSFLAIPLIVAFCAPVASAFVAIIFFALIYLATTVFNMYKYFEAGSE